LPSTARETASPPPRLEFHRRPEFTQAIKSLVGRVAGDDAGIDGPARSADDPVGLDAGFVERLVDAALVGVECAAALEGEYHLARQGGRRLGLCGRGARGKRHVHGIVSFFDGRNCSKKGEADIPFAPGRYSAWYLMSGLAT
jgi:hypothetical protein